MAFDLDTELRTIVGAVLNHNMVTSADACDRIRDEFYRRQMIVTHRFNTLHNAFITIGKEDLFNQLIDIADTQSSPNKDEWNALCQEITA